MLVSLRWLKEFCQFPSESELIEDLNRIGFEVESVTKKGEGLSNIIIGQIETFAPHPDADRLRIAQVIIGKSTSTQIVTAAENVAEGDKIPVSLPGATLANGLKIKKSKLRGIESNGMMCSAVECGLTDTSPGVWVLPEDAPVGDDFIEYAQLADTVIDICILPNRGDAMSLIGLAREINSLYGGSPNKPTKEQAITNHGSDIDCQIASEFCNYYRAQKITGLINRPSPVVWQTRLYYTGQRPLSWLIDITNIVMLETGQPLHAFDANGIKSITVSYAKNNQKVTLLNEKEYDLNDTIPLIKVNDTIAAVAGVMGADAHSVTENTTAIVLESAIFEPTIVRKGAQQLGLRSESSARFEKGVDATGVSAAVNRVHELLSDNQSEMQINAPAESGTIVKKHYQIPFNLDQMNNFLGTEFSLNQVSDRLSPLGFIVNKDQVEVPSWRGNDCHEWPDIAEEMCRFSGIDGVDSKPIETSVEINHNPLWLQRKNMNLKAQALGLTEVIPFPLTAVDIESNQPQVLNPITPELTTLRSNGIQSLIQIAALNASRHSSPCRLFNCGPVWNSKGDESWQFLVLIQGSNHHQPYLKEHHVPIDFYDLKGLFEQLINHEETAVHFESISIDWFHPGQSAVIKINNNPIGYLGMLHPNIIAEHRLPATGMIEFNLNQQLSLKETNNYKLISKYPTTTRDTTYIMAASVALGEVLTILNTERPALCTQIVLCGYYQKDENSEVNVSFRMTYQDPHKSLEMDTINELHKSFSESVIDKLPCRFP